MKLLVLFPGVGYHCDKPILYYGKKVANECGYEECISLHYDGFKKDIRGNGDKMLEAFWHAYHQAEEQLKGVDWSKYDDILFLSKSVGTAVASHYAKENNIKCKNVYYTPVVETFQFEPENGIAFTGSKDPWADTEKVIEKCKEYNMPLTIIEETNHSLELGDVDEDLKNMLKIMQITKEYIS